MDPKTTNAALNRLIEACYDGQHGYQTAAHHVTDMQLKRMLGKFALERKHIAEELAKHIDRKMGTPVHHGTFKGALHRGWMELKGKAPETILAECMRGETASIECFEQTLEQDLPVEIKALIDEHLARIMDTHDQLGQLAHV